MSMCTRKSKAGIDGELNFQDVFDLSAWFHNPLGKTWDSEGSTSGSRTS